MATTVLDGVIAQLVAADCGKAGTSIFAGSDVNLPLSGTYITVMQTAGRAPDRMHNATTVRRPGVQLTARGDIYQTVEALAEKAWVALGGLTALTNVTLGDMFFLSMFPAGDKFQLPNDKNGMVRIAFNVFITHR